MAEDRRPKIESFATTRLIGKRLREEHLLDLLALRRDPQVAAWLGVIPTADHGPARHAEFLEHWQRHGYGPWLLRRQPDGAFVGYAGLRRMPIDGQDEVELLYALAPGHWREGLTSEAALAVVALAFEPLGLESIVARTLPANRASQRIMAETGFVYEHDIVHAGLPHRRHRIRRPPA